MDSLIPDRWDQNPSSQVKGGEVVSVDEASFHFPHWLRCPPPNRVDMPPHISGVVSCLEGGMAYRRTFKASVLEHLSAWVGAGRAGQSSQFQTKAASSPTPPLPTSERSRPPS